jgi:hypothetical protein
MTTNSQNYWMVYAISFGTYLLFLVIPMWGMFRKTGMANIKAFITALIPISIPSPKEG